MSDTNPPELPLLPIKQLIDITSKLIPLGAIMCIAFSILYDVGFICALDLDFREINTSLPEHVRNAVLWFPPVFFTGAFGVGLFILGNQNSVTEKEAKIVGYIAALSLILISIISLMLGDHYATTQVLAAGTLTFSWVLIFKRFPITNHKIDNPFFIKYISVTIPILLALTVFSYGGEKAKGAIISGLDFSKITIKVDNEIKIIDASVIRKFDKDTILLDDSEKIKIVSSDSIINVEKPKKNLIFEGFACSIFGYNCSVKK